MISMTTTIDTSDIPGTAAEYFSGFITSSGAIEALVTEKKDIATEILSLASGECQVVHCYSEEHAIERETSENIAELEQTADVHALN